MPVLLLGYLMGKLGWVTQKGSGEITNPLVRIVVPAAIINSFFCERTPERLLQFGGFGGADLRSGTAVHGVVADYFPPPSGGKFRRGLFQCGFYRHSADHCRSGRKSGVLYRLYSVLVGVLQWTWGVYTITGDKQHVSPRKILTNPATIAMGLALLAFLPGWGACLPGVLTRPVSMMAAVNTPAGHGGHGLLPCRGRPAVGLFDRFNWWASFVRLVLISAATAALFCLVPRLCRGAHRGVHCGHPPLG